MKIDMNNVVMSRVLFFTLILFLPTLLIASTGFGGDIMWACGFCMVIALNSVSKKNNFKSMPHPCESDFGKTENWLFKFTIKIGFYYMGIIAIILILRILFDFSYSGMALSYFLMAGGNLAFSSLISMRVNA